MSAWIEALCISFGLFDDSFLHEYHDGYNNLGYRCRGIHAAKGVGDRESLKIVRYFR